MPPAGTQPAKKSWVSAPEHRRLSWQLDHAEGADFTRRAALLLQASWPQARILEQEDGVLSIEAPHGGEPSRTIACCFGFPQDQRDLGLEEAEAVRQAIRRFEAGEARADRFMLIHNRDGRSRAFREATQVALKALEKDGRVRQAELWSRHELLREAFNATLGQILEIVTGESARRAGVPVDSLALETVRLRKASLTIDQYRLEPDLENRPENADPADLIFGGENLTLVLGEFGTGKTTAIQRAIQRGALKPIYIPGGVISSQVVSTKDLLQRCFQHDGLFTERPDDLREVSLSLARPVLLYLLRDNTLPIVLILDGIDESAVLARRGGFQQLFNMLYEVQIPIVLTMRSELWHREKKSFNAVFGKRSSSQPQRRRQLQLIELLAWRSEQIRTLIERYRRQAARRQEQAGLNALTALAATDRLEDLYGDLPRRPLFLRLILESVREQGLPDHRVGRARLMRDWARFKILRDSHEPIRAGGSGRLPLRGEGDGTQTTLELAWEAMVQAATEMVQVDDGCLELTADCDFESLCLANPRLQEVREPLGLFLNSLLLGQPQASGAPLRIRFAHRSFQEYFLAWALLGRTDLLEQGEPPDSVKIWIRQIVEEGLLNPPADGGEHATSRTKALPRAAAEAPELAPPHPDLVIRVAQEKHHGERRLVFRLESPEGKAGFRSRVFRGETMRASPASYHRRLRKTLERLQIGAGPDGEGPILRPALGMLEALGQELYDELIPPELRKAYRGFHEAIDTLLIVSDEPWISWELVRPYDDDDPSDPVNDDFLCKKLVLTRWLRGAPPPPTAILPRHLACFEAGTLPDRSGLKYAALERQWLQELADRHGLTDRSLADASRAAVLDRLHESGHGILHLVGHGYLDQRHSNESPFFLNDGLSLRARDLRGEIQTALKESTPLFFLNACRAGGQGWTLSGLGGWAPRCLIGCHCSAFIAPQWSVSESLAHAFALRFYEALEEGEPFGRAAHQARLRVRELDDSSPSWLAYAVYAHPHGRLQLPASRRSG